MSIRLKFVFWVVLMTILLSLSFVAVTPLLASPALVQTLDPSGLPPYDPNAFVNILGQVVLVVLTAVGGWGSAPITVWIVAALKRVVPATIDGKWLAALVSLGLMALLAGAASLGYEAQFRQGVSIITAVLAVLAGSQTNLVQSAKNYNAGLAANAPFVSYQRTPNDATTQAVKFLRANTP